VRLKQYLEMRGADSGAPERLSALSAFWVGLLYDQTVLDAAWDLVKGFTGAQRQLMRRDVPRQRTAGHAACPRPPHQAAKDARPVSGQDYND